MPDLIKVELVPSTSFGKNLRDRFKSSDWDLIRRYCYKISFHVCQLCGGVGPKHPVEAHEVWSYHEGVQRLEDIMCLCPACHLAHHPGFANTQGRGQEALHTLMRVNQWTEEQARDHVNEAALVWEKRSKRPWMLDISQATTLLAELKGET